MVIERARAWLTIAAVERDLGLQRPETAILRDASAAILRAFINWGERELRAELAAPDAFERRAEIVELRGLIARAVRIRPKSVASAWDSGRYRSNCQ